MRFVFCEDVVEAKPTRGSDTVTGVSKRVLHSSAGSYVTFGRDLLTLVLF